MEKQIFLASVIAMAIMGLSACNSDDSDINEQQGTPLQVSASMGETATRVTSSDGGYSYSWETTDYIGITGNLTYIGNKPNVKYSPTAAGTSITFSAVTSANAIIADATTTQKYTAYYPWGGTEGTDNTTPVTIGLANTTDYMYAECTTTETDKKTVTFAFKHQLAKFTVKVTSDGTNLISGATWKITSGLKGGSIVPFTGVVNLDNAVTADMTAVTNATPVLVPAQTISNGNIVITANGVTYTGAISSSIALTAGKYKVLSVTIAGSNLTIDGSSIIAWTSDADENTHRYYTDNNIFKDSKGNQVEADFTPTGTLKGHDYVQLVSDGLKWATMNIGSGKIEGYGDYYEWGATSVYPTSQGSIYNNNTTWSVTATWGYLSGDNVDITAYGDNDVAYKKWGGYSIITADRWTIPTQVQLATLAGSDYTWTWGKLNDIKGYKVTYSGTGSTGTGKSIFLPAPGFWYYGKLNGEGNYGYYWSSTHSGSIQGFYLHFGPDIHGLYTCDRYFGFAVRPVSV